RFLLYNGFASRPGPPQPAERTVPGARHLLATEGPLMVWNILAPLGLVAAVAATVTAFYTPRWRPARGLFAWLAAAEVIALAACWRNNGTGQLVMLALLLAWLG